ncbi:MAG: hypothetical protein JWO05_746 [Gemmatimonadetes bacterium]|nr:hypothetical protein [Gemmatimonadota bacterium]
MQVRRIAGLVLLIAAPALAWGSWNQANRDIAFADAVPPRRNHADSLMFEYSAYHAARGRIAHAERWHPTGYATLGLLGVLVGAWFVWPRRKRPASLAAAGG